MESNKTQNRQRRRWPVALIFLAACTGLALLGLHTDSGLQMKTRLAQLFPVHQLETGSEDDHDHSGKEPHDTHDHGEAEKSGHEDHDHEAEERENADRLSLDDASLFNIGIKNESVLTLKLQEYRKSFRMPGIVREIPGRSINNIAAAVSGIVTGVSVKQGDALCPGGPLLEIRLTHEEAIQCQTDLITLLQKQDVIRMETERLASLAEGIVPKRQRELLLEKVSNDAAIQAQKNLLKIHGFTEKMIEENIVGKREAVTRLIVRVPEINENGIAVQTSEQHSSNGEKEHYQILEKLLVNKGDSVRLGDILCQISDLRTLQIEGKVFAANESIVNDAFLKQSPAAAIFADAVKTDSYQTIEQLKIARVDSFINQETQTVSCWINLPNRKLTLSDGKANSSNLSSCGEKTISWRFKPGQRCELAIGYETIKNCFVLPPEAIASDRSNAYLFELTGIREGKKVWTKKPVRILYRASDAVVVANDGTIRPGMKAASTGAEQLYTALGSGSGKLQSACEHDH
ncbi:MAG: efflux RND transporter periplasmic adaptor subunit [Planctomycetia bacterium]|nr:efflux RND transporter periplasmic adaptor subunit [Planctomycetia bacterium]